VDKITLSHGSGGKMMHELLEKLIVPSLGMEGILTDSAVLSLGNGGKIAFSTDSFVVSPLFFPGGNIGDLAVNGTVNDLSMMGAVPKYLTASFIIEEGFEREELEVITKSIFAAARRAGVRIVSGDTKVVNKGKGDGIFINTAGIGVLADSVVLHPSLVRPGDKIIVSSSVGNHGVAVMSIRNGLSFDPPIVSDSAPLNGLVQYMLQLSTGIHAMRDPTRGGLATTLKEVAVDARCGMVIDETRIPVERGVLGACELLGIDPLYVANEGVLVAFVDESVAEFLEEKMRDHPLGKRAAVIGDVVENNPGMVLLRTRVGGTRIVDMLIGEQLPRIC
jgi:hydrogenase expression/formation protein HypE